MKAMMAIRLTLAVALLVIFVPQAAAQVPAPWDGAQSFWNNPETAKSLNLTSKQQAVLNNLLNKANEQLRSDIRGKFTPQQWKQIQSLRAGHSRAAARMGLEGPDAQKVASALKIKRIAAQDYMILTNEMVARAAGSGAQYLGISRTQTIDPCKSVSEAAVVAAPNLDPTQLQFTLTLEGVSYAGNTCPAAMWNLKGGHPIKVTVTYPCAFTSQGVDLAPDCKISSASAMYEY